MSSVCKIARLNRRASTLLGVVALALVGCGGGSSDDVPTATGTFAPSTSLAQRCSPANPFAAVGLRNGSLGTEKQWLRSYMDEAYLWYDEVPAVNANAGPYTGADVYVALDNYFEALKTPNLTSTGTRKDQFSFTYPTAEWQALSQAGVIPGYGFELVIGSRTPPNRNIRIAYIEPGSEAATKGLQRGDQLLTVNGVSADDGSSAGIAVLQASTFPTAADLNRSYTWVFTRAGAALPALTLTVANITKKPVLSRSVITATDGRKVGYLLFNDHMATAEAQLIEAVNYLQAQAASDLVLDLRYNGGGFLYIASELAYMIAGPARTAGQVFEQLSFNAKRIADTRSAEARTPFYNANSNGSALPTLNLARVYVLAQGDTCSASESIINSLRGVGVDVRLIGAATCGKPYGFSAQDNCGISYFPIEFKGTNATGFGDYTDGFVPAGAGPAGVPGCTVSDDLGHALGDPAESMLGTALGYRSSGNNACPVMAARAQPQAASPHGAIASAGRLVRGPARENRIVLPGR